MKLKTSWLRATGPCICALALVCGCVCGDAREEQRRVARRLAEGGGTAAESPAPGAPLASLVEFALAHRPSMKAAELDVIDARLAMEELKADAPLASTCPWRAPKVDLGASYAESSRPAHSDDFKAKTKKGDLSATLSVDLTIYDFGRWDARVKAQAKNTLAAEEAMEREGYTVFNETAEAYFTLAQNIELERLAQSNIVQYTEHLREAESRFEAGEAQKLDVLVAKLDLANAREAAVSAANNVTTARARLAHAIGAAPDARFLPELREEFAGRAADGTAEALFAHASTNAPAMKIARARLEAASAQVDYTVADLLPNLGASLSLNWTDPLWYWRWGVSAAQNLFAGGRNATAVERAVNAMLKSESELDAAQNALARDMELAVAERDSAAEAERAALDSLRQAEENYATVVSQYEVGEASRIDFTDAVAAKTAAETAVAKAKCRRQIAIASIYSLTGEKPVFAK